MNDVLRSPYLPDEEPRPSELDGYVLHIDSLDMLLELSQTDPSSDGYGLANELATDAIAALETIDSAKFDQFGVDIVFWRGSTRVPIGAVLRDGTSVASTRDGVVNFQTMLDPAATREMSVHLYQRLWDNRDPDTGADFVGPGPRRVDEFLQKMETLQNAMIIWRTQ